MGPWMEKNGCHLQCRNAEKDLIDTYSVGGRTRGCTRAAMSMAERG